MQAAAMGRRCLRVLQGREAVVRLRRHSQIAVHQVRIRPRRLLLTLVLYRPVLFGKRRRALG